MAAVSTLQYQKRKKAVYGKSNTFAKYSSANVDAFFSEDELAASKPTIVRRHDIKSTYAVQKTEAAARTPRPVKPRVKRKDTFEGPFSDDEDEAPTQSAVRPKFSAKPALFDETDTSYNSLAPRENKRAQSERESPAKRGRVGAASSEAQLKQDLARASNISEGRQSSTSPSRKRSGVAHNTSLSALMRKDDVETLSATARLAARQQPANSVPPKRSVETGDNPPSTPRKRARTSTDVEYGDEDVHMADADSPPACDTSVDWNKVQNVESNVYDLPESSADEHGKSKPKSVSPGAPKQYGRRGKTAKCSKPTARKGISAPARLTEIIATDTDTTDAPTCSPSSVSRMSTPQQPSTPPSRLTGSPDTAIKANGTMTPKQAQLWSKLLTSETVAQSPSALPMRDLSLSGKRRAGTSAGARKLTKSQSDVPRRRSRLVDRLKASAASPDTESSDAEQDEGSPEAEPVEQNVTEATKRPSELQRMPSQTSQSQSQNQTTSAASSGPKITYSRVRSHLPEDSLEGDLMMGFDMESPQQVSQVSQVARGGKSALVSQKSAFDLDDSDHEGAAAGKIRNIHELRASGRDLRGMQDIEELLSEIQNHNVSHRGRRRSALIELATKLADKAFAARFVGQSLEIQLVAECQSTSEEIAEFILAASIALIVASEPPEHTLSTLRDQGVITWLSQLLYRATDILKTAKDRRTNMSKVAQASLFDLTSVLSKQSSLWDNKRPSFMTTRLIALKALDLLITRLRRLGDRTDLLSTDDLLLIPPTADFALGENTQLDVGLSMSVLESLSTTSASLEWNASTIKRIADILRSLDTTTHTHRHTLFLTLRLCLNLTNDNKRNCRLFAREATTIQFLLQAVKHGFDSLDTEHDEERRTVALDILVLAMGIVINLAENCDEAREHATGNQDLLFSLIEVFQQGQRRMLDADSVEESISNVAFGYLAVMLANLCQHGEVKTLITLKLPGQNLGMLIEAVEEFVQHHQKVDTMNFEGEEGMKVWGAFTEKLKAVLEKLRRAEYG